MKASPKHFTCLLLILLFFVSIDPSKGQTKIDSLAALLKKDLPHCAQPCVEDTARVSHLNQISWLLSFSNSDTALVLGNEALQLAEKILKNNTDPKAVAEIKIGLATAYSQIGSFHDDKDEYIQSMECYAKAMTLWDELLAKKNTDKNWRIKVKLLKANTIGNLAIVYRKQGDYPKALDCNFECLKIDEEIGNKKEIATDLGNVGVVYHKLQDYPKTLDFYNRALRMEEELGNKVGVARVLGNLGGAYAEQKAYDMALNCFFKALAIAKELGNEGGIARHLGNIGNLYYIEKDYVKALDFYQKSMEIKERVGSKSQICSGLRSIGELYAATKRYGDAEPVLKRSLAIAEEIGSLDDLRLCHQSLRDLYKDKGDYAKAFDHFQKAVEIKDSIFNEDKDKEIMRKGLTYEFEKKEAAIKAEQEKKDAIADINSKRQKLILVFVSLGLLLVFVFAGFVFRALRIAKKQKTLIEEKNKQTEEQKQIIEQQKEIVEEKNKDIIDSINYAKRIQDALLKEQEHVSEHLPEHFILYKPKDIVSGDFYWALEKEGQFYIAAVDCTGHGVPGAFMSMLGVAFLNEITAGSKLFSPAEILDQLRTKVVKELRQSGKEQETNDGMDMSIVRYDLKTMELQWAGANNPLYVLQNGVVNEIKPNKQCIGYNDEMEPFVDHKLQLSKGNSFYLFTDGYADQFGGSKGKKFKYSQLKELFLSLQNKPAKEQKAILDNTFESWKGRLEQVDDVCVIGVRI